MVMIAFYKKPGHLTNAIIRWRTQSQYSHCELVMNGLCYSAAGWDGGVRRKAVNLADGGWDLVDVPWADERAAMEFFGRTLGHGYDYVGAIVGGGLHVGIEDRSRWFCSEWCAAALGMDEPWRFTPADLAAALAPWARERIAA